MAYRSFGSGPALVFIHGFPLSGFTWRFVVPALSARFTCHVFDSPGAGETRWKEENDFSFSGQAANYQRALEKLAPEGFSLMAQDTGATIAREIALRMGSRVNKLVAIDTE